MYAARQEEGHRSAYVAAWSEYAKRRNFLFISFLGFVPFLWVVAWVLGSALTALGFKPDLTKFIKLLMYSWGAFCLWSFLNYMFWPCPRCGNTFAMTSRSIGHPFAQHCVHCGLTKAELKAAAREQPVT